MESLANNMGLGSGGNMSSMIGMGAVSGGDAHFFEDTTTPAKVKQYLDSTKVHTIMNILVHALSFSATAGS